MEGIEEDKKPLDGNNKSWEKLIKKISFSEKIHKVCKTLNITKKKTLKLIKFKLKEEPLVEFRASLEHTLKIHILINQKYKNNNFIDTYNLQK